MIDRIKLTILAKSSDIILSLYSNDSFIGLISSRFENLYFSDEEDFKLNNYKIKIKTPNNFNQFHLTRSLFNSLSTIDFDSYINSNESFHVDLS